MSTMFEKRLKQMTRLEIEAVVLGLAELIFPDGTEQELEGADVVMEVTNLLDHYGFHPSTAHDAQLDGDERCESSADGGE